MRHSDLILLGLLADEPAHAYRLHRQIEEMRIRSWAKISQATVYRGLERLEGDGHLAAEVERGGDRPDRTVYRITAAGRERLRELVREALSSDEPPYSDRLVGAVFSTLALDDDRRRRLLEGAIERVEASERRLEETAAGRVSPLGEAIVDFYRRVTSAEFRLLRAVRSSGLSHSPVSSDGRPSNMVSTARTRRAWVEVDPEALRRNYRRLEERVGPDVGLLPMVKADAYGLGVETAVDALGPLAPWGFGVASTAEAAGLRELGWGGRLVVFAPTPPLDGPDLVRLDAEPAVSSLDALRAFGRAAEPARPLPVHLEVDTGMGRAGLLASGRDRWIPEVTAALVEQPLELAGTFTHFHSAESDEAATTAQAEELYATVEALQAAGVDPGIVHLSNSAAVLRHPELSADLVRPGIFLYGAGGGEPVATVRARVLDVREVPEGHTVSYGALHRTAAPTRLATLGVGYGDGLRRALSDRGRALVEGRSVPVRGAVCMDVTVVDVTDVPEARAGTVATVLGRDGAAEITVEEMARACGTIPYEILTGLGRRLPRIRRDEIDDREDDVA